MAKNSERISLIITTICIVCIDLANLWDYIESGDPGGWISNLCFVAATVCLVIGWIGYLRKQKK